VFAINLLVVPAQVHPEEIIRNHEGPGKGLFCTTFGLGKAGLDFIMVLRQMLPALSKRRGKLRKMG
jgi:hypothetical protein